MRANKWSWWVDVVRQVWRVGCPPVFCRVLALLGGVAFPVICFASALPEGSWNVTRPWQSGLPRDYAFLMTKWPVVAPFYPLLIYCMVCCGLVATKPQWARRSLWVRGGIYTGLLFSLPFHCTIYPPEDWRILALLPSSLALGVIILGTGIGWVVLLLLWQLLKWLEKRFGSIRLGLACLLLLNLYLGGTLALSVDADDPHWWHRWLESYVWAPPFAVYIAILMCGTTWATLTYGLMSVHVWRHSGQCRLHFGLLPVLGSVGWLAAYLAAWRAAVKMALVEYAQLPAERPGCYVCTAAARGHSRLMGHWSVPLASGDRLRVNRQMQWLKAGEIAFRSLCPAAHAACRYRYDRWGRCLARCICHAWIADLAYFTLKPCEWSARLGLAVLQIDSRLIAALYPPSVESENRG